jgi:CotS family spore coat protein
VGKQFRRSLILCFSEVKGVNGELSRWEKVLGSAIRRVVPFQRHWRVITDTGDWICKTVRHPRHVEWWIWTERELRQRGFKAMPTVRFDGHRWMFSSFLQERTARYRSPQDALSTARLLASFHRAGQGLFTPSLSTPPYTLVERVDQRLASFASLLNMSDRIPGETAALVRDHGAYFYRKGQEARQRLALLPFRELVHWNRGRRFLAHRDLASHNVMVDSHNRSWLIDFETADYDCQVGDVWQFLTRMLSEQEWDLRLGREAIRIYESIRPLSSVERQILTELLAIPNEFYRESLGVIQQKKGYHAKKSLPYLGRIVRAIPKWQAFLGEIRRTAW